MTFPTSLQERLEWGDIMDKKPYPDYLMDIIKLAVCEIPANENKGDYAILMPQKYIDILKKWSFDKFGIIQSIGDSVELIFDVLIIPYEFIFAPMLVKVVKSSLNDLELPKEGVDV